MSRFTSLLLALLLGFSGPALCHADRPPAQIEVVANLPYKTGNDLTDYEKERCQLDLYLPSPSTSGASLVWLYGGGLTGGSKDGQGTVAIARTFARAGIAVAVANYRLSPKVKFPAYAEDAAAAFAWVRGHIAEHGGDPRKVFLGGHSAGAYLTSLVGMDGRYLAKFGLQPNAIAGLIPISGQMMTHFTVRQERGIGESTVIADEAAPIYYTRKETAPFLILMGDHDWPARLEENQYFAAMQKTVGNEKVTFQVIPNRTHGSIAGNLQNPGDPAAEAMVAFINRISAAPAATK